jgi:hypothetical protein
MEYMKPELNAIGAAEGLVLGQLNGPEDAHETKASGSFEFEE